MKKTGKAGAQTVTDLQDTSPLADPTVVISHSASTDQAGALAGTCYPLKTGFQFLASSDCVNREIQDALSAVLNIRNTVGPSAIAAGNGSRRWNPTIVQICAAAEMAGSVEAIQLAARTVQNEFDRSLADGLHVLIAYVGLVDGALPPREFFEQLDTIDHFFDLVVVVSDSDTRGRRYVWQDIEGIIVRFIDCLVRSRPLQHVLLDAARASGPANRRVTIGLAKLDVSAETLQASALSYLSKALFGILFQHDDEEAAAAVASTNVEYLTSRQLSTGGKLSPVVSALVPVEGQLADEHRKARARELARQTADCLSLHLKRSLKGPWRRLLRTIAWPLRRVQRLRRPERRCRESESDRITQQKAKVFEQLLRLKQIELRLQPVGGLCCQDSPFPLDLSLADLPAGNRALIKRLPDVSQIAWELAQGTSLEDLLSGRVTAKELAAAIDSLWKEHQICEKVQQLAESEEMDSLLKTLASRVSPLMPSVVDDVGRLILQPPNVAGETTLDDYQTAVGSPGQFILVVAGACSDLGYLEQAGDLSDG